MLDIINNDLDWYFIQITHEIWDKYEILWFESILKNGMIFLLHYNNCQINNHMENIYIDFITKYRYCKKDLSINSTPSRKYIISLLEIHSSSCTNSISLYSPISTKWTTSNWYLLTDQLRNSKITKSCLLNGS